LSRADNSAARQDHRHRHRDRDHHTQHECGAEVYPDGRRQQL